MILISRIATLSFAAVLLAPGLDYDVPDGWETVQTSSRMRLAQWALPGDGDEAAEVVIFFFGPGQGGGRNEASVLAQKNNPSRHAP